MRIFIFVTFLVTVCSFALPNDVPADHWAAVAVADVVQRGWLQGYPGGAFRGQVSLDRYQLATTLARVLADSPLPAREAEVRFKDVKPNHWALPGIRRMVGEGLVQGFPDQTYRGESVLTRYQLALVLDKLTQNLGVVVPAKALRPEDLPAGHWAETAVLRVVALEILPLGSEGLFRGTEPVNRYQMARALWRIGQLTSGPTASNSPAPASLTPTPRGAVQATPAASQLVTSGAPQPTAGQAQEPAVKVGGLQSVSAPEGTVLGQISRVPLPEGWFEATLEQSLVHLGQAQKSGQVWATLQHQGRQAIALLRLAETPSLEAFFPMDEAVMAASEGWAWLEGGQKLLYLDPKTQKTRLYGPIGQGQTKEALPPVFAAGVAQRALGGVALDESRNYLALISGRPLCLPDCGQAARSPVLRLVLLGLNPDGLFAEYAYLLDSPGNQVVGLAWPKPRLLLVHEHDGVKSRIYSVDLNQADDLAFTEWDSPEAGLELRPQVRPLPKKLVLEAALENPRGLAITSPSEAVIAQKGLLRLSLDKPLW
ncbi:S-layer homology domain-containing protein [Meiothermus sp.]|uniref:S-layer homology domain-containing protein n=1 Tax=Meiothermus sp. TaxID=1955249 RepID=UPI0026380C03|nr:S-layer homology domain-containing protein [Meiothermus sp.]